MYKYLILLFFMIIIYFLFSKKIKIVWKTFLKKGFKKKDSIFGVYCYCGKQGSSKTGNVVSYLYEHRDMKIYANLKSIDKESIPYTYIKDIYELLELRQEHDCIIMFDEIFTVISKESKLPNDVKKAVMDFLSQMRKRRIIFLTTCQEWRLLPLYFRLYVRYQINCSMFNIPFFGAISIKNIINGDHIKWSDEEQDFVGELVTNIISHCVKRIYDMYDTYEQIGDYSNYSTPDVARSSSADNEGVEKYSEANFDTGFWDLKKGEIIYEQEEEQRVTE